MTEPEEWGNDVWYGDTDTRECILISDKGMPDDEACDGLWSKQIKAPEWLVSDETFFCNVCGIWEPTALRKKWDPVTSRRFDEGDCTDSFGHIVDDNDQMYSMEDFHCAAWKNHRMTKKHKRLLANSRLWRQGAEKRYPLCFKEAASVGSENHYNWQNIRAAKRDLNEAMTYVALLAINRPF